MALSSLPRQDNHCFSHARLSSPPGIHFKTLPLLLPEYPYSYTNLPYYTSFPNLFLPFVFRRPTMDDKVDILCNGLSLTEVEASLTKIEPENHISPINALVGRLAIRKFVSLYDLEKGLRSAWDVKTP